MRHSKPFRAAGCWVWRLPLVAILFALGTHAQAAGRLVDCVQVDRPEDAILGVTFGEIPYAEYRCRFRGSLTLPYDATGMIYNYDMPVWIIAPANLADGNGTVIVDPFHSAAVISTRPSGSEGEQPLGLKMLGPRFLFRSGTDGGSPAPNYTWVGVRWDARTLTTTFPQSRYDHVFEQRNGISPGTLGAPIKRRTDVGKAMVADLADALRSGALTLRGASEEIPFAAVERVIGFGQSQVGQLLRLLLDDPPSEANGGGAHNVPLFDGWLIAGAGATYDRWPLISAAGDVTPRTSLIRLSAPPSERGLVMEIATEQDIGGIRLLGQFIGNEFVRFGDTESFRSYEIAGASHISWGTTSVSGIPGGAIFLPDLADSLDEVAAISSVTPGFTPLVVDAFDCPDEHPLACTNPLDWNPVLRAMLVALENWLSDPDDIPPPSLWILPPEGEPTYGDQSIGRDALGNALGGIRLPDVEVGRGHFFAETPDVPFAGANPRSGAYIDRHDRFRKHGHYVSAFSRQAELLVEAGFLLPDDADLLITSAAMSRVGKKEKK